jgi:magnesium transporter
MTDKPDLRLNTISWALSDNNEDAAILRQALKDALAQNDIDAVRAAADQLHAADLADFIEQVAPDTRMRLIQLLGAALNGEVLTELEEGARDDVVEALEPEQLADALQELETDDVVYIVEALEPEAQTKALETLEPAERAAVTFSLSYPEYSAGRLIQREVVWAPEYLTVGDMIDQMRSRDDLPAQFYEIVVVDPAFRPLGVVALGRLMATKRPIPIADIMEREFHRFNADQSQEDVAYAFNQYHLVSAPVVEESGRLAGVITIDDAMQALSEEAQEDILRLGGVGDESLVETVSEVAWGRFPWLAANLVTAILASLVIGVFDKAIEQVVALAILMPIVASMGGNAATQTMTVAVRALATKDLTGTNTLRIIARETIVGLINGLAFAGIVGLVGYVWFGDAWIGVILSLAMIITMLAAGLAGILIPLGLQKLGVDPALASGVFVTTVTDVAGFCAFLGIAVLILF